MHLHYVLLVMALCAVACIPGLPPVQAAAPPGVTLVYPPQDHISPTGNISLSCSATDDENVYSMSLYHDIGGNFSLYDTNFTMGLQNDSSTLLFCSFDDSGYTCLGGEEGTASDTSFEESAMGEGVMVDGDATLYYEPSENINGDRGTIEMWINIGFDPLSHENFYLLSTDSNPNDLQLWKDWGPTYDYGTLKFEYYSSGMTAQTAEANISSWSIGEWHHIAAIWDAEVLAGDGRGIDLFLDGQNLTTVSEADFYMYGNFGNVYIGSQMIDGGFQPSSLFDEFSISSVVRSAAQINASYNRFFAGHSAESYNWSFINASDGTYTWNCKAKDNETQTAWGSSNYTFTIDAYTPPAVVAVNLMPSDEASLDPGVSVAVTANVTDISNVSSVILMYKSPYAGLYTNDTMYYNSGTGLWENANINTTQEEGNWSYRIWANDSWGHAGMTSVYKLDVRKDRAWTLQVRNSTGDVTGELESVKGFKGTVQTLGMLVINNTGDYVANFDLSEHFGGSYSFYVSYNVTEPFDLPPGNQTCIQMEATMPETPNEYVVFINITTTSVPEVASLNTSVISFIGGPYINETTEIVSYPISIGQSGTGNFTAVMKNIGNDTAYNVTLNWTLPDGWSLSYGNESEILGDLAPYEYSTRTVTAYAGTDATAGAAIVLINASSINGTAGSDFKILSVTCTSGDGECGAGCTYATDTDCEEPAGGGTVTTTRVVGVGTVGAGVPAISVSFPERIDMQKGEKKVIEINVTNAVAGSNVTNVTLDFAGYEGRLVSVSPAMVGYINPQQTVVFRLEVSAPAYVTEKTYFLSVTVKAIGTSPAATTNLESSSSILLSVHGVMGNESLAAIEDAQKAIEDLRKEGLNVANLEALLSDARRAYESMDFDSATDKAMNIIAMRGVVVGLLQSFESLEGSIDDAKRYGVSVSESRRMMELAKSAFQRGDYGRAQARITAAVNAYQLETKGVIGVMKAVSEYWPHMIALFVCMALVSFFARRSLRKRMVKNRLLEIKRKKEALKTLLSDLQKKYYEEHGISRTEYAATKGTYSRRVASLSSEELRLRRESAGGKKGSLDECRKQAEDELAGLQREFFERGGVGKEDYEFRTARLQAEIADIEKDIARAARKKAKGVLGLAVMLALLGTFVMQAAQVSPLGNVTADDAAAAIQAAGKAVSELEAAGLGIERANGTLASAKDLFSQGSYELSVTSARYVSVIKDKAFSVDSMLDQTEMRLQEFSGSGFDVSSLEEDFGSAFSDFSDENYEDAEVTLSGIEDALDEMERESLLEKAAGTNAFSGIAQAAYDARVAIAVALAACAVASIPISVKVRRMRKRKRLEHLRERAEGVKESMRMLQKEYFSDGTVGKRAYMSRMEKCRKDLAATMESIAAEHG